MNFANRNCRGGIGEAIKAFGDFNALEKQRSTAAERGDNLDVLEEILTEAREDEDERRRELRDKPADLESPDREVVGHILGHIRSSARAPG